MQSRALTPREASAFRQWLVDNPEHGEEYRRYDRLGQIASRLRARADLVRALPAYDSLKTGHGAARLSRFALPLAAAATIACVMFVSRELGLSSRDAFQTAHGEVKDVSLPDGSHVKLNTDSTLRVEFSGQERRVVLARGEAYFEVVKESGGRPFIVYSRGAQVRVVGTKFNVRASERGTEVIVSEGRVEVLPERSRMSIAEPPKVELTPGNEVRIESSAQRLSVAAVNVERATAWRGGTIDFDNATLEEMIAEVNRYSRVPFTIVDDRIRPLRLSGTFRIGDAESVRFALRDGFGIEAIPRGDRVELRGIRPQ
jgi:transmembrane sensor